jgi:hypothetical protein
MMPAGITLLCVSLVIYKLSGAPMNISHFVSGVLVGAALVIAGTYIAVAAARGSGEV